ncbi:hypothetical protein D3C86_1335370 [compost metagenome]
MDQASEPIIGAATGVRVIYRAVLYIGIEVLGQVLGRGRMGVLQVDLAGALRDRLIAIGAFEPIAGVGQPRPIVEAVGCLFHQAIELPLDPVDIIGGLVGGEHQQLLEYLLGAHDVTPVEQE